MKIKYLHILLWEPGYRNEYQISAYYPVGTFGYRNEYQISTYSPVGTPGIEMNITYLQILL
jgi:hypothetical protein